MNPPEQQPAEAKSALSLRRRYQLKFVISYALLASAWILLSDQLLTAVVGVDAMVHISSTKGHFFILVSALAFYVALGGMPDRAQASSLAGQHGLAEGLPDDWPAGLHHLLAIVLVLAALGVHRLIGDHSPGHSMLVLFMLPISVAALLGGIAPGLTATALAAALTRLYVLAPRGEAGIADPLDLFEWGLLVGSGIVVSLLGQTLRRSRTQLRLRLQERNASHAALLASEARVQQLYDDAPVAMALVGWDGRILSLNRQFVRLFGYGPQDLQHMDDWWRLAYPDEAYRQEVREVWELQRQGQTGEFDVDRPGERLVRAADGRELTVQISRRVMDQGLLTTFVDITAAREAEKQLRLWAEAFAQAQVGLAISDARSNRITAANPAFARERGYETQELAGEPISVLFPPEKLDNMRAIIAGADLSGHGVIESEHRTRDGRIFPVLLDVTTQHDAEGRPMRRIVFALDLTERRRAEQALAEAQARALEQQNLARIAALNQMQDANIARERVETALRALRESENRLELFIAHAPAALAMFDRHMGYIAASQRWRTDYGLGDRDLRGLNHYEVFPEISEDLRAVHRRGLAGEVMGSEEYRFERSDGGVQWVRWEMHPWLDSGARVGGIVIFTEDITARKLAEDELNALNLTLEARVAERTAELAALNQSLESFVYSVSHDLKAPLRGVEGYSRFLLEDYGSQLDDEGRLFIGNIRAGVARMGELIDDLLAYSRMERRQLAREPVDLADLVAQVVAERATEMALRPVELQLDIAPLKVQADRDGLEMVLRNLLENAIKFTAHAPAPRITITARPSDTGVELSVTDNGVGFDMKYHDRIFEIFQRLQRVEDYPGTGVGLALVKKAMDRMGGRVWADSAPGQGACFHLELPLAGSAS